MSERLGSESFSYWGQLGLEYDDNPALLALWRRFEDVEQTSCGGSNPEYPVLAQVNRLKVPSLIKPPRKPRVAFLYVDLITLQ